MLSKLITLIGVKNLLALVKFGHVAEKRCLLSLVNASFYANHVILSRQSKITQKCAQKARCARGIKSLNQNTSTARLECASTKNVSANSVLTQEDSINKASFA